jgi:macrodomain Ter protein organizer (MatP/YcbG family)
MARERYTITDEDLGFAVSYLSRKLKDGYWLSDDVSRETKAERAYEKAKRDAVTLTEWGEKWLSSSQWTQLKNAVRAARRRQADLSRDPPKHVTLSHRAWLMLHELAERDGVTLSELIEKKLEKAWVKL